MIPPEVAARIKISVRLPETPEFLSAVGNTIGAQITKKGLILEVCRRQKESMAGDQNLRTGVFYLPEKRSFLLKYYKPSRESLFGGPQEITGVTMIKAPLIVRASSGGVGPAKAYDFLEGKGAYEAVRGEMMKALPYGFWAGAQRLKDKTQWALAPLLNTYGGDSSYASYMVEYATRGNQLPVAIMEHIVAHRVRRAGYDSVLSWNNRRTGPIFTELFDLREETNPSPSGDYQLLPFFSKAAKRRRKEHL